MEQALTIVVTKLMEHGPWGLIVAWLMYQNWRKDELLGKVMVSLETIQERRADERAKSAEVMVSSSAASIKMADALARMSAQVEEAGDSITHEVRDLQSEVRICSDKVGAFQTLLASDIQSRGRKRV